MLKILYIKKINSKRNWRKKINLSIAATKTIGEYIILNQVSNYLDNTENNIKIEVNNTEVLLELLDNGKLDLLFIEGNFDSS